MIVIVIVIAIVNYSLLSVLLSLLLLLLMPEFAEIMLNTVDGNIQTTVNEMFLLFSHWFVDVFCWWVLFKYFHQP